MVDYVMTIDSDSEEQRAMDTINRPKKFEADDVLLNPGFTFFEVSEEELTGLPTEWAEFAKPGKKPVSHRKGTLVN